MKTPVKGSLLQLKTRAFDIGYGAEQDPIDVWTEPHSPNGGFSEHVLCQLSADLVMFLSSNDRMYEVLTRCGVGWIHIWDINRSIC